MDPDEYMDLDEYIDFDDYGYEEEEDDGEDLKNPF